MQEMLYPTSYLKSKGLGKACALVTDGRFSGGTSGLSIGHASPEAAEGGLIALVQDGDRIEIDIPARSIRPGGRGIRPSRTPRFGDRPRPRTPSAPSRARTSGFLSPCRPTLASDHQRLARRGARTSGSCGAEPALAPLSEPSCKGSAKMAYGVDQSRLKFGLLAKLVRALSLRPVLPSRLIASPQSDACPRMPRFPWPTRTPSRREVAAAMDNHGLPRPKDTLFPNTTLGPAPFATATYLRNRQAGARLGSVPKELRQLVAEMLG